MCFLGCENKRNVTDRRMGRHGHTYIQIERQTDITTREDNKDGNKENAMRKASPERGECRMTVSTLM